MSSGGAPKENSQCVSVPEKWNTSHLSYATASAPNKIIYKIPDPCHDYPYPSTPPPIHAKARGKSQPAPSAATPTTTAWRPNATPISSPSSSKPTART